MTKPVVVPPIVTSCCRSCDLRPQVKSNLGELLFSLSYLPTAERLTIVIMKARNLSPQLIEWQEQTKTISKFGRKNARARVCVCVCVCVGGWVWFCAWLSE